MEDVEKGTSRSRRTKDTEREWSYPCMSAPKVIIKNVASLTPMAQTRAIQNRNGYLPIDKRREGFTCSFSEFYGPRQQCRDTPPELSGLGLRLDIFSTFVGHIGALGVRCKNNAPDKTKFISQVASFLLACVSRDSKAPIYPINVLKLSSHRPNRDSSWGKSLHYYLGP